MQAASHFVLRPFVESDAVSFAEAVRESGATVGKWMSWAHAGYTDSDALSWFSHCAQERANGASHEFGIFDAQSRCFVGGCGLNQFNALNGFCNLGYWVVSPGIAGVPPPQPFRPYLAWLFQSFSLVELKSSSRQTTPPALRWRPSPGPCANAWLAIV
ncbi:GNAT family N-acetyltransferase [Variovorax paradoxus NBRC 15149]|nr:GNAT family N-acetyltransferase [Variovorax paradoxus]